ncbi:hypothetical protein H1Z61_13565 [Bacillus aquiflavi]|uniref:Uncharacterized protein n=1 Tax=Bacillus aquiflavi TaxID=2672567 RepID=A0A6B3W1C6_9BACI|nr:hypothetical protein [Bacillus aquiflavi]MBA4538135.1 hypothetical protein [Bacillus aquiflavi]NEY82455.1 hypothetical protein [Bacillus aquiflavi]UAC48573.1 hypothetical protein K6959_00785 [Bacillus aquiflavi]
MKKTIIICLIALAFGLSIYAAVSQVPIDESTFGNREIILFSIPFTMILVNRESRYFTKTV